MASQGSLCRAHTRTHTNNIPEIGQHHLGQTHSLCRERFKHTLQHTQDLAGLSMLIRLLCQWGCLANTLQPVCKKKKSTMIKGTLNFFANITTFCPATRPVPQCPQGLNSNACGQMFLCPAGYEFSGLVGTSPIMQWIPSGRSFEHCLPLFQRVTAR